MCCVLYVTSNITSVQKEQTNIQFSCKMFYINVKVLLGDIWFLLYKYKDETQGWCIFFFKVVLEVEVPMKTLHRSHLQVVKRSASVNVWNCVIPIYWSTSELHHLNVWGWLLYPNSPTGHMINNTGQTTWIL